MKWVEEWLRGGGNQNYELYRGIRERKYVKWVNRGNIRCMDKFVK